MPPKDCSYALYMPLDDDLDPNINGNKKCLEEHMVPPRFGFGDQWTCPHHECINCGIRAAAAGGLLFRCECCDTACCEDHLPVQVRPCLHRALPSSTGPDRPLNGPPALRNKQRRFSTLAAPVFKFIGSVFVVQCSAAFCAESWRGRLLLLAPPTPSRTASARPLAHTGAAGARGGLVPVR